MSPFQAAKTECANCDSSGNCAGIGIGHGLRLHKFRPVGKCWLAETPIQRCNYFEECVVPLSKSRSDTATSQEQRKSAASLADAVHEYTMAFMVVKYAQCRGCRERVLPPKRLCPDCATASRRKSTRAAVRKLRSNVSNPSPASLDNKALT